MTTKHPTSPESIERTQVVAYLRRQADGCEDRAAELEEAGEVVMAASLRAMRRTLEALSARIETGAHRSHNPMSCVVFSSQGAEGRTSPHTAQPFHLPLLV